MQDQDYNVIGCSGLMFEARVIKKRACSKTMRLPGIERCVCCAAPAQEVSLVSVSNNYKESFISFRELASQVNMSKRTSNTGEGIELAPFESLPSRASFVRSPRPFASVRVSLLLQPAAVVPSPVSAALRRFVPLPAVAPPAANKCMTSAKN